MALYPYIWDKWRGAQALEAVDLVALGGNGSAMSISVANIYRYPVKGLTPEGLDSVALSDGQALPGDRHYAMTLGTTQTDGRIIAWMEKTHFLSLLGHEKLAKLKTTFDPEAGILTIKRRGRSVAKGDITTPVGRAMIEEFFAAYMGDEAKGRPKLVEAEAEATLSDHRNAVVSFINLASVMDLQRVTGADIDPLRFRGNFYLDGLEAWEEFQWVGKEITVGGARLSITKRIDRCGATSVNPQTGERDLNLVKDLQRGFGHIDMGVYGRVIGGGQVNAGDELIPPA